MKCQWARNYVVGCRRPPVMLAKGLSPHWAPICAYHKQKRVGNPWMEYKPIPSEPQEEGQ